MSCSIRLRSEPRVVWLRVAGVGRVVDTVSADCYVVAFHDPSVHCVLQQHAISVACHTSMQAGVFAVGHNRSVA